MNDFYVYELVDPRNNLPFYIGKGKDNRLYAHLTEAKLPREKQCNTFKCAVINNILLVDKQIIIRKIKDSLTEDEAFELEIQTISKYGKRIDGTGILTNIHDGGIGCGGNKKRIEQYSITGAFINSYESLSYAAKCLNIHKSTICAALNGRTWLAGNTRWVYQGELITPYINNKTSPTTKFDIAGNSILSYNSIKEASKDVNTTFTSIIDCINGRHHTAGGFRWAYYGEQPNPIPPNYVIPGTRKFACYNDNMELVNIFDSLQEAINETGAISSGIIDRCAGRVKYKTGGYYWKYYPL